MGWRRSGIALAVAGLAVARGLGTGGAHPLFGALVAVIGLALWLLVRVSLATAAVGAPGRGRGLAVVALGSTLASLLLLLGSVVA